MIRISQESIGDAIEASRPKNGTVEIPEGIWQLENMDISNCHIKADSGARFVPLSSKSNMIYAGVNCSWTGGILDCSVFEDYSGRAITITGLNDKWPSNGHTTRSPLISDIWIYGRNSDRNRGSAISLISDGDKNHWINNVMVEKINIYRMFRGVYLFLGSKGDHSGFVNGNIFSNISISATAYAIDLFADPDAKNGCHGNLFNNFSIQPSPNPPAAISSLKITGCNSNQFTNCFFWDLQNCAGPGIDIVSGKNNRINTPVLERFVSDKGTNNYILKL